jgi:hypothetical protein
MKSLGLGLLHLTLLLTLFACGKDNESGKKSAWSYNNPYSSQYGYAPVANINSPYSYSGMTVNQVMQQNPCRSGYGGMQGYAGQSYAGQRIPIQVPMTQFPTVIPPNDIYVGVTSFGDVAVVVGQAAGQPPLFVGYMCPRSFAPSGQGQLMGVKIGSYSNCLFKPITASSVVFPGGGTAEFRWLDGGSSQQQKFSFCR